MKKSFIILVALIVFCGCEQPETKYYMDLVLQNNTENSVAVELFPNGKYKVKFSDDMYYADDVLNTCLTKFIIVVNSNNKIFESRDISQQPCDLLSSVFDSILISIDNENQHFIKFSKDTVIGYSENIFTEETIWKHNVEYDRLQLQLTAIPVEIHQFTFDISDDKFIK